MKLILSIGTNLGDRISLIRQALERLTTIGTITAVSPAYETAPWGFASPNKFINIALTMETPITAVEALDATQAIERQLGRTAKSTCGYSDRPIDIDLIDADGVILDSPRLTLPHPLMQQRNFVLYPLSDIAPDWLHPTLHLTASQLKAQSPDQEIQTKTDTVVWQSPNNSKKHNRLIIFDFDGTLADTAPVILATYAATIKALRLPERSAAECRATIGLPLPECFRQLFPDAAEELLNLCVSTYRTIFTENKSLFPPTPYPGVKETVAELYRRGCTLSIASSRSKKSLVELCGTLDILEHFSLILGCDDVERAKPDPQPVLKTLGTLGFQATETVVVGDMPVDIMMGKRAGCSTIGVDYGNSTHAELVAAGASATASSFPDIIPIIANNL